MRRSAVSKADARFCGTRITGRNSPQTAGLAALGAERQREQVNNKPLADLEAELDRLQRQRMQIDGRYSVMKFRTYQFLQDAKTLAIKLNICQTQLENLRQANELLRNRLEE